MVLRVVGDDGSESLSIEHVGALIKHGKIALCVLLGERNLAKLSSSCDSASAGVKLIGREDEGDLCV